MRTRMSGRVGGEDGQPSPLSQFHCSGCGQESGNQFQENPDGLIRDGERYLCTGLGCWVAVRASGFLGDQSSGGNATRQNCGRRAENSKPISALLPRTGPRNTTLHSCSSLVVLLRNVNRLPLVTRACSKTSAPCALMANVSASSSNGLP